MGNESIRVVVGMSGGVDSSVAAALLLEQGYSVIGAMLRLWSPPGFDEDNRCCSPDAVTVARRVSAKLGIPFYVIDAQEIFYERIVQTFIVDYQSGLTPNPCILCNQWIRWGFLLQTAIDLGGQYLATGHYARVMQRSDGMYEILKGIDPGKDQSYVLSALNQDQLAQTMLPLGGMDKQAVRNFAQQHKLPSAKRPDSQDLCFTGGRNYRDFLRDFAPQTNQQGQIRTRKGEIIGEHTGLADYTIGQRKGLRIAYREPLYVIDKDQENNALIVGTRSELGHNKMIVDQFHWILGEAPAAQFVSDVKIRYKSPIIQGRIDMINKSKMEVRFQQPVRDITPGQRAVLYDEDRVLGGGVIISAQTEEVL